MCNKMKGARPNKANLQKFVLVAYWRGLPQFTCSQLHTDQGMAEERASAYTKADDVHTYQVMTYGQALTLNYKSQRRLQP